MITMDTMDSMTIQKDPNTIAFIVFVARIVRSRRRV